MVSKNQVEVSRGGAGTPIAKPEESKPTGSTSTNNNTNTTNNNNANASANNNQPDMVVTVEGEEYDYDERPVEMPWGYKFFHLWLPRLHFVSAWTLLILNLLVPGLGTIIFSFKWLGYSDYAFEAPMSDRCRIFAISLACGIAQLIFTPIIIGWGFAILTGLMAVQQSYWIASIDEEEGYYDEDGEGRPEEAEHGTTTAGRAGNKADAKGPLPGRVHGKRRKHPPPPGWVYRLYPYNVKEAEIETPSSTETNDNKKNETLSTETNDNKKNEQQSSSKPKGQEGKTKGGSTAATNSKTDSEQKDNKI